MAEVNSDLLNLNTCERELLDSLESVVNTISKEIDALQERFESKEELTDEEVQTAIDYFRKSQREAWQLYCSTFGNAEPIDFDIDDEDEGELL